MGKNLAALPSITEFLFEAGLYIPYSLEEIDAESFLRFRHTEGPLDGYCIWCEAPTMFVNPDALPYYAKGRGPSATHHRFENIDDYIATALQSDVFRNSSSLINFGSSRISVIRSSQYDPRPRVVRHAAALEDLELEVLGVAVAAGLKAQGGDLAVA